MEDSNSLSDWLSDFTEEEMVYATSAVAGLLTQKGGVIIGLLKTGTYSDNICHKCIQIENLLKKINEAKFADNQSPLSVACKVQRAAAFIRLKRILFQGTEPINGSLILGGKEYGEINQVDQPDVDMYCKRPYGSIGFCKDIAFSVIQGKWKPSYGRAYGENLIFKAISAANVNNPEANTSQIVIYHLERN